MIYLMNASLDQTSPLPFQYKFQSYVNDVDSRVSALKSYQIDVDIGSKLPPDNNVTAIKLFSSDVIILAGKLPENGTLQLSQQEWESSRHAVWAGSVDFYSENVEGAIRATDFMQSRNVKFISSNMVNMASVCAKNDCIMLVPSLVAPMLMKLFALHQLSLPVGLKLNSDCYLHFHEKLTQEPELLESIRDVITRLQAMLSSE
jgi:DNA-binding transcriptional LysR family regulator